MRNGDAALTGPVSRGDVDTVRTHLEVLSENSPQTVDAYRVMARLSTQRALDAGVLSATNAERLLEVLGDR